MWPLPPVGKQISFAPDGFGSRRQRPMDKALQAFLQHTLNLPLSIRQLHWPHENGIVHVCGVDGWFHRRAGR
jgi:hypothetical protein